MPSIFSVEGWLELVKRFVCRKFGHKWCDGWPEFKDNFFVCQRCGKMSRSDR